MIETSKHKISVSSKGQIVIPLEIRRRYGYGQGTELVITPLDENRILLETVPKLSEFSGFLRNVEASRALLTEREREARAEKERRNERGK